MVNPFQKAWDAADSAKRQSYAARSLVVSVNESSDVPTVRAKPETTGVVETCAISQTALGDSYIPRVGDRLLTVRRQDGKLVAVGCLYGEGDQSEAPPKTEMGERVIGIPDSDAEIRLSPSGNISITADDGTSIDVDSSDGTVRVNDGNRGCVVDVDFSNQTITRSNSLFVP